MAELQPNIQKPGKPWRDESNIEIPFNRISKVEQTKELYAGKIYKAAARISADLAAFKTLLGVANEIVNNAIANEALLLNNKYKPTKGNFTWFSFDRSVKIELNVAESIKFDEAKIASARDLFDSFIEKNVQGTDDVVRQLINSAFANSNGGLDAKKVLSLLKFRTKIKDKQFQQAMDLIQDSISRPSSKKYFRVRVRDEEGAYQNVELNFSSI